MTSLPGALTVAMSALLLAACSSTERSAAPIDAAPTTSGTSDSSAVKSGNGVGSYGVGDIGPGGGLVFMIYGGLRYEMAPNTWGAGENGLSWCDGIVELDWSGEAIGDGAENTSAMAESEACGSEAAAAVLAYSPNGTSAGQWFLPSKDELNAMCNYSRNPNNPPIGPCAGAQNGAFLTSAYGFARGEYGIASDSYWSSSLDFGGLAWSQMMGNGASLMDIQPELIRVRPIRSF